MEQACFSGVEAYGAYMALVITALSALANFVPNTGPGKIVHWLALNFKVNKA